MPAFSIAYHELKRSMPLIRHHTRQRPSSAGGICDYVGVRFDDKDCCELVAYDGTSWVVVALEEPVSCVGDRPDGVLLDVAAVAAAMRESRAAPARESGVCVDLLTPHSARLTFGAGPAANVAAYPGRDFPWDETVSVESPCAVYDDPGQLMRALEYTRQAVSSSDDAYLPTRGVCLAADGTLVGTDGHRIHVADGLPWPTQQLVVTPEAVNTLVQALRRYKPSTVTLTTNPSDVENRFLGSLHRARFQLGDAVALVTTAWSRHSGPSADTFFAKPDAPAVSLVLSPLMGHAQAALINESPVLCIVCGPTRGCLAGHKKLGSPVVLAPLEGAAHNGATAVADLNPSYVLDALRVPAPAWWRKGPPRPPKQTPADKIEVAALDAKSLSPVTVRPAPGFRAAIMPMRP